MATARSVSGSNSEQQGLGQPGEVPLEHPRLVAVRVPAPVVDRAEHRRRVEAVHERARAVVDGLAGDGGVVGVHHAVDEPDEHPSGHEIRLTVHHVPEQLECRDLAVGGVGQVPGDGVVDEAPEQVDVARGGRVLERADAQVAGGDAGEHGAGQHARVASDALTRGDHGERAGGGDAERVHGLADDVLAQHRSHGRLAVAAAGETGASGALQVQVVARALRVEDLPEQQRPTVAQSGRVVAELVARVGQRDRFGPLGDRVADEDGDTVVGGEGIGVGSEFLGEAAVERQQPRRRRPFGLPSLVEPVELACVGVVEPEQRGGVH